MKALDARAFDFLKRAAVCHICLRIFRGLKGKKGRGRESLVELTRWHRKFTVRIPPGCIAQSLKIQDFLLISRSQPIRK